MERCLLVSRVCSSIHLYFGVPGTGWQGKEQEVRAMNYLASLQTERHKPHPWPLSSVSAYGNHSSWQITSGNGSETWGGRRGSTFRIHSQGPPWRIVESAKSPLCSKAEGSGRRDEWWIVENLIFGRLSNASLSI